MMKVMTSIIISTMLASAIMLMCMMISTKSNMDREKLSPFECGFDPKSSPRMPFSIQFFLIAVIFLIFDIEIAVILPMIITMKSSNMQMWFIVTAIFILTLILGLFHEWNNGVLEWIP